MRHEQAGHGHMTPTEVAGANAKIVLLAVALGEQILTKQSDFLHAVAPEIDAEPVC